MTLRSLLAAGVVAFAAILPAQAQTTIYTTMLTGGAEVPPNNSFGSGVATVTVDLANHVMHVQASFTGLSSGVTAAHVHCCTTVAGTGNAGVATSVPTFTGFPSGVTSGVYDHTFDLLASSTWNPAFVTAHTDVPGAFAFFVAGLDAGTTYFNIHTSQFTAGEIRGFLHAIPEPRTYALMLVGLTLVGWVGVRRRPR